MVYVFVDGKLVQKTLAREGLARIAFVKDNHEYLQTLEKAQEEAKNHGLVILISLLCLAALELDSFEEHVFRINTFQ